MRRILILLSALLAVAPASAELIHADPSSFVIKRHLLVAADTATSFDTLVHIERWWSPEHTWSGDAKNLVIEPRVRGCWCERWPDAEAEHGRVIFIRKNAQLRLQGAIGPLQDMAVNAVLDFSMAPENGGTRIDMMYRVTGAESSQLDVVSAVVDEVLMAQMDRLKARLDALAPVPAQESVTPADAGKP